jgi:hypothetical protein
LDPLSGNEARAVEGVGDSGKGGTTLSKLPPPVREEEFQAIDTTDEEEIRDYFRPFVNRLNSFLNETSCLRDIQDIRRRKNPQITSSQAFVDGYFSTQPKHWYTHNAGGRNEAQFNIGMFPDYLRVGLGFEFREQMYGNPPAVQTAYGEFWNTLVQFRQAFDRFAQENSLKVEWVPQGKSDVIRYVPTQDVAKWLLKPKPSDWIFVGRLLDRKKDAEILEDSVRLKEVMESVFKDLKPLWEQTQTESI